METKKIYVLLQGYQCLFGDVYKRLKGTQYNHASLGIVDSMDEFYSFRSKWGLCIEHPFRFNKPYKKDVQCMIYEIEVTSQQYSEIQETIQSYLNQREHFHFSYTSLLLGFLGIRHNFKQGYTCSKFVAEVLEKSGVMSIGKHTSLCLPTDFENTLTLTHYEGLARNYKSSLDY
ncbi:hypothetical protein AOC36_11390 [Erysipelothrix larvae]|uniref:Peptidase n=1 Tax=Erysipelothrix larvae TaxID=1514105 RepID=A0A0X8H1W9_9FIRM|nr:hypothetical protein [Erysipelothrix larvae]AMC94553.1 hypothetical protein AOC36_11390 [Erysipelothrix larvae]